MKKYGTDSTHLKLTGKALEGYTLAGDYISEITEDETGYTIHTMDGNDHYSTEAEAIAQLEEYADLFHIEDNEKQFGTYTVRPCTAVALCDEEDESRRQPAVYVTTVTDGGERVEHVVFGWNCADLETDADFNEMCADSSAWEPFTSEHHIEF